MPMACSHPHGRGVARLAATLWRAFGCVIVGKVHVGGTHKTCLLGLALTPVARWVAGLFGLARCIIYTSAESHYSLTKAAFTCGFGTDNICKISTIDGKMNVVRTALLPPAEPPSSPPRAVNARPPQHTHAKKIGREAARDVCSVVRIFACDARSQPSRLLQLALWRGAIAITGGVGGKVRRTQGGGV